MGSVLGVDAMNHYVVHLLLVVDFVVKNMILIFDESNYSYVSNAFSTIKNIFLSPSVWEILTN